MALTLVSQPQYTIDTPGFENRIYGGSSNAWLDQPGAVNFCKAYGPGFRMSTADELVAFRNAALGTSEEIEAMEYHRSGTTILYSKVNGILHMAFDDDENCLVVAHAQDGYYFHVQGKRWTLPSKNADVRAAFKRAEKNNRVVPAPLEDLVLSTAPQGAAMSEYSCNAVIKAALPWTREVNAQLLHKQGYAAGRVYSISDVDDAPANHVEIRCLGVGEGVDCDLDLDFYGSFDCGRVRPVRTRNA